jgi:hypothetical protein
VISNVGSGWLALHQYAGTSSATVRAFGNWQAPPPARPSLTTSNNFNGKIGTASNTLLTTLSGLTWTDSSSAAVIYWRQQ